MGTISVMKIYQLTPKTNCKECGRSSCMAFAADLAKGNAKIEECPYLLGSTFTQQKKELEEYLAPLLGDRVTHIDIDEEKCDGCAVCILACPVEARYSDNVMSGKCPKYPLQDEHLIFQIYEGKAKLVKIDHCRRLENDAEARNCSICQSYCPQEAIKIY